MKWLEAIKAGDPVVISTAGLYSEGLHTHLVDRLTSTQIIIGEWRFRRSDGKRIGDTGWHGAELLEPKPELLAAMRRTTLVGFITKSQKKLELLPLEELEAFAGRLNAITPRII